MGGMAIRMCLSLSSCYTALPRSDLIFFYESMTLDSFGHQIRHQAQKDKGLHRRTSKYSTMVILLTKHTDLHFALSIKAQGVAQWQKAC